MFFSRCSLKVLHKFLKKNFIKAFSRIPSRVYYCSNILNLPWFPPRSNAIIVPVNSRIIPIHISSDILPKMLPKTLQTTLRFQNFLQVCAGILSCESSSGIPS